MPNTRSQGISLTLFDPKIQRTLRRMARDNANDAANEALNLHNQNPPPGVAENQPPHGQQAVVEGWNPYILDPIAVDVTRTIMLPLRWWILSLSYQVGTIDFIA